MLNFLRKKGFDVHAVYNIDAAIKAAAQRRPGVVIIDAACGMGAWQEFELKVKQLLAFTPAYAIMIGSPPPECPLASIEINQQLTKPIELEKLSQLIREQVRKQQAKVEGKDKDAGGYNEHHT